MDTNQTVTEESIQEENENNPQKDLHSAYSKKGDPGYAGYGYHRLPRIEQPHLKENETPYTKGIFNEHH